MIPPDPLPGRPLRIDGRISQCQFVRRVVFDCHETISRQLRRLDILKMRRVGAISRHHDSAGLASSAIRADHGDVAVLGFRQRTSARFAIAFKLTDRLRGNFRRRMIHPRDLPNFANEIPFVHIGQRRAKPDFLIKSADGNRVNRLVVGGIQFDEVHRRVGVQSRRFQDLPFEQNFLYRHALRFHQQLQTRKTHVCPPQRQSNSHQPGYAQNQYLSTGGASPYNTSNNSLSVKKTTKTFHTNATQPSPNALPASTCRVAR